MENRRVKMDKTMKNVYKYITVCLLMYGFLIAPAAGQDEDRIESFVKVIKKTEELYNKAVQSYEAGEFEKAEKYYQKAMQKLYLARLAPDINYKLKEEFDNLFTKMDVIFQEINGAPTQDLEISAEELEKVEQTEVEVGRKYAIPINTDDVLVKKYLYYYTGSQKKTIQGALERSGRYREMILKVIREYGLPEELIYLPVVESLYKVRAYSSAGAVGIWQLMTKTAQGLGLKVNYWIDERKDPEMATRAALKYLKELYEWFNDWHLALAAYNRGEAGIGKDMKFSKATDYQELQKMNAIPRETKYFVPKFMASTIVGDNYREYGFELDFQEPLEYDEVYVNDVIDLEVIARCVNSTVNTIKGLNPSLIVWCTPKNYPNFKLRLPAGTKELFQENITKVENLAPTRGFVKYRVKKGDVLGNIARKFNTTAYAIKRDNRIKNVNRISIGKILKIQPGRRYFAKKYGQEKPVAAAKAPVKASGSGYVKYRVKSGDILFAIANKFNTTVNAIKKDNAIRNADRLKIGQVLSIKPGRKYFERKS